MSVGDKSITSMIAMLETLWVIRKECFYKHSCDECMFQDTICGVETTPVDWDLELLKERIKERW